MLFKWSVILLQCISRAILHNMNGLVKNSGSPKASNRIIIEFDHDELCQLAKEDTGNKRLKDKTSQIKIQTQSFFKLWKRSSAASRSVTSVRKKTW